MTDKTGEALGASVRSIVADHAHLEGPLLPILHAVQAELGYVPEAAAEPIADALNISRAEVHGVISFYHDFHTARRGRHTIKICRAEACQASGGQAIEDQVREILRLNWNETTPDGVDHAGAGLLSRPLRLRPQCAGGRQAGRQADRRRGREPRRGKWSDGGAGWGHPHFRAARHGCKGARRRRGGGSGFT